jgi:hypothetical protein
MQPAANNTLAVKCPGHYLSKANEKNEVANFLACGDIISVTGRMYI